MSKLKSDKKTPENMSKGNISKENVSKENVSKGNISKKNISKHLSGEVSGMLREIDDELKLEKIKNWAKKYGAKIIVTVSVILVIGVATWLYQVQNIKNIQETGTKFSRIIEKINLNDENIGKLLELQEFIQKTEKDNIYKVLAQMKLAELYTQQNQDASPIYQTIIADEYVNDKIKTLAKVKLVAINIDTITYQMARKFLEQIALNSDNPWRFIACELLSLVSYKEKLYEQTKIWIEILFENKEQIPINLLARADIIRAVLEGHGARLDTINGDS